jgi:hypothetical protein
MRISRIFYCAIFVLSVSAGALLGSAAANAQALFRPATPADESAAAAQLGTPSEATIRRRIVRIDGNALTRHAAPAGADLAANRVQRAKRLDGVLVLNLFPDLTATFRRSDVTAQDGGGYIWEGEVAGQQFHEALLLIQNGDVDGRVQLESRLFEIKSIGKGLHQVIEYDPSKIPQGAEPLVPPIANTGPQQESAEPNPEALTAATANILVAYTAAAVTEAGTLAKLKKEITVAIALANQSYVRAKVPLKLKSVGIVKVNYNEGDSSGNSYNTNLTAITNGTGVFGALQTKRNQLKADLVTLIRKAAPPQSGSFVCGLAWIGGSGSGIMGPVTAANAPYGYSVVGRGICLTDLALGHELGHNMGMQHDRFVYTHPTDYNGPPTVQNPPPSIYNFGYTNLPKKVHTIMAYYVQCYNKWGSACTHINWFSSPTIRGPGNAVIGIAANKAGAADNTRRLRSTYKAISHYR